VTSCNTASGHVRDVSQCAQAWEVSQCAHTRDVARSAQAGDVAQCEHALMWHNVHTH